MNIESTQANITTNDNTNLRSQNCESNNKEASFAKELQELKDSETKKSTTKETSVIQESNNENKVFNTENNSINKAINGLNEIVKELNQSDDKLSGYIKNEDNFVDNKNMINNDFNIQDNKDILPQMNPGMNFSGNGQPFSSFMNNDDKKSEGILGNNAQDLAEERAILSSMSENIAIANKHQVQKNSLNCKSEETTRYPFDNIIMNQADVEVFVNIVENGQIDIKDLPTNATEKSIQISKTLADILAKSKENNQPVRIDFDNNISIIIRISRDGKITADFLPSSQVAEVYLKENLPLLKQRFDENNIEYDSLNYRERKEQNKEQQNRKKDRNNE